MAKPIPLPLGVKSSPGRTGHDGGARLINAYAEEADDQGKAKWPVWAIEGLASLSTLTGGGAFRGGIVVGTVGYVVSGTAVFKVDSGGGVTNIGSFPGSDPVFMAQNRAGQVALVSGGLRYTIIADAVASIADADLPAATSVATVDGYGVWTVSMGRFFISAIDDFTSIDALDFATAESNPDTLLVAYARGQEIVLFGPKSVEFWRNTGAAFPFERIPGTTLQNIGLLCRHSVRDINDIPFFVASDGTVRMLSGYQPVRVSTHDQERSIDSITDKDSITATAYSIRGHDFYVISSPSWTWAFDATTGLWHERQSYGETRWRAEGFLDIDGTRAVGDFESGLLYRIDPDTYTEAGNHLVWTVRTPPVHAYPNRLLINRLFVDPIPGVGLNSGVDHTSDPQIMLRYSDNGSKDWSSQRTAAVGKIGETKKAVRFERLGMTGEDGRIFEFSMSAAVIRGLTGGAIDAELVDP